MKKDIEVGAWVVAAQKALSKWNADELALDPFESIIVAGRAGELFSATRALGAVDGTKFETYRKLAQLKPIVARQVLKESESLSLADVTWSKVPGKIVDSFRYLNNSKEGVLEGVGKLFARLEPSDICRAALEVLNLTLELPTSLEGARNFLSQRQFPDDAIETTIKLVTSLGLLSKTREKDSGSSLLFNPFSLEGDPSDVYNSLRVLSQDDQVKALAIIEQVRANPGVPVPASIDKNLLTLLVKLGVIDYSKIVTATGQNEEFFPTAPHVWGHFDRAAGTPLSKDLLDDSKLMLNSFRFGQYFSHPNRGKIRDPQQIVNALIRNGAIGIQVPATAIGEDYPLPLSRGIVNVVESPRYPGRYSMELLKFDVALAVKEVLEQNALLPSETVVTKADVERANTFGSPAAVRVEKELPPELKQYHEEMIFTLRTSRRKS